MNIAIMVFLGLIGAAMGSFVGAMTWRIKNKKDFVKDRSECEYCHHKLEPLDLVPIFSWVFLRGKCRYCKAKIGVTTLILEVSLAAAFVISYAFWPLGNIDGVAGPDLLQLSMFLLWLAALVLLTALFTYDIRWQLLPDRFMWPLVVICLVLSFLNNIFVQDLSLLNYVFNTFLAMIPVFGVYAILYILSRGEWIGFGDVKFGIAVGLLLNWQSALLVLVLANVLGSIVMLPMLATKKATVNSQIAFGPFLIAATFAVFLFNSQLMYVLQKYLLLA